MGLLEVGVITASYYAKQDNREK